MGSKEAFDSVFGIILSFYAEKEIFSKGAFGASPKFKKGI
jgi:hypothetical protein